MRQAIILAIDMSSEIARPPWRPRGWSSASGILWDTTWSRQFSLYFLWHIIPSVYELGHMMSIFKCVSMDGEMALKHLSDCLQSCLCV